MGGLGAFKTAMEFRTISEHIRQQILKLQNSDLLDTKNKLQLNNRVLGRSRLHRSCRRMLETKCSGDNLKVLVSVLVNFVIRIHYCFTSASGTNNQKMSPNRKSVTNIRKLLPTLSHQHHYHFGLLKMHAQQFESNDSMPIFLLLKF